MYGLFRGRAPEISTYPENVHRFDEIVDVLRDANEPLRMQEIKERVSEMPLTKEHYAGKTEGAFQAGTWHALNGIAINYPGVIVKDGRKYAIDPNWDGVHLSERIPQVGKPYSQMQNARKEREEQEEPRERLVGRITVPHPSDTAIIPCFGLSWHRQDVHWDTRTPALLGQENQECEPLNFADQIGVYILYNWPNIVYVGRTSAQRNGMFNRLYSHHTSSRRSDKWDRFSWFGLKGLEGKIRADLGIEDEIALMETVLIEALSPPFNDKKGDNLGTHFFQVPDPVIQEMEQQRILDALLGALQNK